MGIAAPQIGIGRTAAVVMPPGEAPAIILLNPKITDRSDKTDEQCEGRLSFSDVRGLVHRPCSSDRSRGLRTLPNTNSAVRRVPRQMISFSGTSRPSLTPNSSHSHTRRTPALSSPAAASRRGSVSRSDRCSEKAGSLSPPSARNSVGNSPCRARIRSMTFRPTGTVRDRTEPWLRAVSRAPVSRRSAGTSGASAASSRVLTNRSSARKSGWSSRPYFSSRWARALVWNRWAASDSCFSLSVNAAPVPSIRTSHRSPSGISCPSSASAFFSRSCWTSLSPVRSRWSAPDTATSTFSRAGESG
ncbi:MAG TPA: peptide deformylase [Streptomyces sp.]